MRSEWWSSRAVLPLGALAAAVPLLWPRIPPFADVPGHMASYHVSIALARSATLQRFFAFDWQLVGNLGVDLLVVPLAHLFGVELATKLIVLAIPALTALALLLLARQTYGRLPATALSAVPLAYNFPFLFGFVNYSLAAALALLGLVLWRHWPSERRPLLRLAAFALVAAIVWLAHAIGWLMLIAMCGAFELHRRLSQREKASGTIVRCLIGTALACVGLLAPLILMRLGTHADQRSMFGWLWLREMAMSAARTLRDRWGAWDAVSIAILGALVAAALFRVARLRLAPSLGWPALAVLALFFCLPMGIDGSLHVNTRLFPYALALALVSIDTAALALPRRAALAMGCGLFCAARLAGNAASFYLYDASYTRELAALDHMPRGATVMTLVEMSCAPGARHRLEHIAGIATVRRDAYVNVLWTIQGLQLLRDRMPQLTPFRDDPSEFVSPTGCAAYQALSAALRAAPLSAFTHLWLIQVPVAERPMDARLVAVWSAGNSVLYRIKS